MVVTLLFSHWNHGVWGITPNSEIFSLGGYYINGLYILVGYSWFLNPKKGAHVYIYMYTHIVGSTINHSYRVKLNHLN